MLSTMKYRDFRMLFLGQTASYLGDQFHLVALPWLVLTLTRDPLQLGLVLAAAGVPRAALMLLGGAWADRFSPKAIMLGSDILRAAITFGLVAAIASGSASLWMVYALAIAFGIVSGFFLPAAEAAVPRVLPDSQLERGNSLIMSADQVATFVGPVLAGTLIALLGGASPADGGGLLGVGVAFALDGVSFLISAATLLFIAPLPGLGSRDRHPFADVAESLRYVARHPLLRMLIAVIALGNFFTNGPLLVGVPVLAATRFSDGAAAFGIILSAYGLGNLGGMLAAGTLPRIPDRALAPVATVMFSLFALTYAALGFVASSWTAAAMMVVTGLCNGYVAVLVITALQRLAPKAMMGRVMSLVMLAMVGLGPISQILAGVIIKTSVIGLFGAAGAGMLLTGALVFAQRALWRFPAAEQEDPVHPSDQLNAA